MNKFMLYKNCAVLANAHFLAQSQRKSPAFLPHSPRIHPAFVPRPRSSRIRPAFIPRSSRIPPAFVPKRIRCVSSSGRMREERGTFSLWYWIAHFEQRVIKTCSVLAALYSVCIFNSHASNDAEIRALLCLCVQKRFFNKWSAKLACGKFWKTNKVI